MPLTRALFKGPLFLLNKDVFFLMRSYCSFVGRLALHAKCLCPCVSEY